MALQYFVYRIFFSPITVLIVAAEKVICMGKHVAGSRCDIHNNSQQDELSCSKENGDLREKNKQHSKMSNVRCVRNTIP